MKKLFYTIIAFAGILAASCSTDEDKLVFDPSSSVAPTLGTLAGTTLSSDGADLTFEFTQPKYNVDAGVLYALYASDSQDFGKQEKLAATIGGTTVTVKQSALNSVILNLGGEPGAEFTVYLRLDSWLANNKNTAVESSLARSGVLSATFVPYSQLILDKDIYDHVWVMGDYSGWSHDKAQLLYNYSKDGNIFTGVVDFDDKAASGIKFTGAASWDEATGNWGTANPDDASEAASVTLLNGSNDNIMCYAKRFYKFTLDKKALVLTKEWGADKIGIVGTINNWAAPDVEMTFNKDYLRFWVDLEVTGDQEIKFRADEDWVYNWGADAKSGGDNIKVGTGKYRVYLDLNKGTVELNEKMYGKTEPSAGGDEPEPGKPGAWSLIGEIGGSSWSKDFVMTQDGDVWTSPVVNITGGFKIRYDYSWEETNTYGVAKGFTPEVGVEFTAVQPGDNITVPAAGDYKVVFNSKTLAVTISAVAFPESLYIIGDEFGSWDWKSDGVVEMTPVSKQEGQFWTVRYFSAKKGFKYSPIRDWGKDFHSLKTNDGYAVDGSNCTVEADGFYMVHVDLKREMVHVEPARIYGMGDCFGGWDAGMEAALFKADGKVLKATLVGDGEIRMYAESSIANSDWWTREFIVLDGKIVYRGNGDDQKRVNCTKGQEVTLDLNAGTGSIK